MADGVSIATGVVATGSAVDSTGTTTLPLLVPDGTALAPGLAFTTEADGTGTGLYKRAANVISASTNGVGTLELRADYLALVSACQLGWTSGVIANGIDAGIARASANSLRFAGSALLTTTSRTELNSTTAAIADNVATAVLTITVPNAAHSASMRVRVTGSAGAGGAIGANEATATNEYIIAITRTAGVNAVVTISAAYGAAAATVAGANAITCVAAMSAVSGAVGATNTFTVNATIARAAGTATNHTCLVYAQLMNANATGVTIA